MATLDVNERLRTPTIGVPKPWLAFGLAAGLWVVLYVLGAESLQVLRHLRF